MSPIGRASSVPWRAASRDGEAAAGNSIWGAVLWSVGIAAVFAALSINRYKRAVIR